jgi:cyanophycinase-like exopeptidase
MTTNHGPLILFGSGETARQGRQVQEEVLKEWSTPVNVAILVTPSGFQPNADFVVEKLRSFVERSLQNYKPRISLVRANRKGGPGDPDDPEVYAPLLEADYILAGPGSPTYTVRQLIGTRTWDLIRERWSAGAALAFSSAAAIALSTHVLPVYEIYKAGEDLHWRPGLGLLDHVGLDLAIVPHWNNAEGGANLDTSHCFMSAERFAELRELLPPAATILGIDEHTSCIIDVNRNTLAVRGQGQVRILRNGEGRVFERGEEIDLALLGESVRQPHPARA